MGLYQHDSPVEVACNVCVGQHNMGQLERHRRPKCFEADHVRDKGG